MRNKYGQWFFFMLLGMVFAGTVFADAGTSMASAAIGDDAKSVGLSIFRPSVDDQSVFYLGQIFGSVEGVLPAVSGQILGQIFTVFNWAMELVAGSFMAYSMGMSLISTANEGSFMGERTKGFARSLRGVAGVGLLVPLPSGYSSIQVFILWMCVQGIGMADYTWKSVTDFVANGGNFMVSSPTATEGPQMEEAIKGLMLGKSGAVGSGLPVQVLISEICVNQLRADVPSGQGGHLGRQFFSAGTKLPDSQTVLKKGRIYFGGDPGTSYWGICGVYELQPVQGVSSQTSDANELYEQRAFDTLAQSVEMGALAYLDQDNNSTDSAALRNIVTTSLMNAGMNYVNMMGPVVANNTTSLGNAVGSDLSASADRGWVTAGGYYLRLTGIHQAHNFGKMPIPSVVGDGFTPLSINASMFDVLGDPAKQEALATLMRKPFEGYDTKTQSTCNIGTSESTNCVSLPQYAVDQMSQAFAQAGSGSVGEAGTAALGAWGYLAAAGSGLMGGGPAGAAAIMTATSIAVNLVHQWHGILMDITNGQDPLVGLNHLGQDMIDAATTIWVTSMMAMFLVTMLTSIMNSESGMSDAMIAANKMPTSMILSIVTAMIVNGVVFSVYLPFVPMLLYMFAVLGWVMTVVEAVVAGPLVALGVTHPEGHDLLGKAEQALMLLLSVFMRPVLILIGFLVATIMMRVAIRILNVGFGLMGAVGSELTVSPSGIGGSMAGFVLQYGAMLVYSIILVRLINFCYSLVQHVPNRTMKWIGLTAYGAQYGTGERELSEVKGATSSGVETAAKPTVKMTMDAAATQTKWWKRPGAEEKEAKNKDQFEKDWKEYAEQQGFDPEEKRGETTFGKLGSGKTGTKWRLNKAQRAAWKQLKAGDRSVIDRHNEQERISDFKSNDPEPPVGDDAA